MSALDSVLRYLADRLVIGANLIPEVTAKLDLGSAAGKFKNLYLSGQLKGDADTVDGKHVSDMVPTEINVFPDALFLAHYDGPPPFNTDFSGNLYGHRGQVPTVAGGVICRPGKFGKAVQVAEGATNVIGNPSAEVNVTDCNTVNNGFGTSSLAAAVRDTVNYAYGLASYKLVFTYGNSKSIFEMFANAGKGPGGQTAIAAGASLDVSAYFGGVTLAAGALVKFEVNWYNAAHGWIASTEIDVTSQLSTGVMTRVSGTAVAPASTAFALLAIQFIGGNSTVYMDAVQLELKAYATPYCDGSLGPGHVWTGTVHASTSTRAAATLEYPIAGNVSATAATIAFWFIPGFNYDTAQTTATLIDLGAWFSISYEVTDDAIQFYYKTSNHIQSAQTFLAGIPIHIAVTWDAAGNAVLYVNGVWAAAGTGATPVLTALKVGWQTGGFQANGLIDDLLILPRALSAAEVKALYDCNMPASAGDVSQLNQGWPAAKYITGAGQIMPNGGPTVINFETKVFDTHNLVVPGAAWKFWPNSSGIYHVQAGVMFTSTTAWYLGEDANLLVAVNGAAVSYMSRDDEMNSGAAGQYKQLSGGTLVAVNVGDYIDVETWQASGGNLALHNDSRYCFVNIHRVA